MDFITGLIQLKEMLDVSWRSFVDELMCGSYVFLCCAVLLQMSDTCFGSLAFQSVTLVHCFVVVHHFFP